LGLNGAPVDPTTMSPDELVADLQRSMKSLMALGAKMPKELMLFVKNMMFLDGSIATLAPDLDLFGEIEAISHMFAEKHGARIMAQLGLEQTVDWQPDLTSIKGGFGLDESTTRMSHRELQERRMQIRQKFDGQERPRLGRRRGRG
jgi:ubiquinone biosynthesis protein